MICTQKVNIFLVYTVRSGYEDALVFVCVHASMRSLTKHAVHTQIATSSREQAKRTQILAKGKGKGNKIIFV